MKILQVLIWNGDSRSVKAKKNIVYSIGVKGIDSVVQLLLVPVALGYLNPYEYGIWLTLNSILLWINSFDIGLGNGLRNQLAVAVANSNWKLAKSLVSTAYVMVFLMMLLVAVLGTILVLNIDWYKTLGTTMQDVGNLTDVVYYTFLLFCVNLVMKFIGNVYMAMQMPSVNNLIVCLGHTLSLVSIYILSKTTEGSLLYTAIVFSLSPIIVYFVAYPITFGYVYKHLMPSIRYYNRRYLPSLLNVGFSFFVLQVSGIVLFSLSNLLISNMFGPKYVTPYNITFRYFGFVTMCMSLFVTPMWSATTDAFTKGDYSWIENSLKKVDKVIMLLLLVIGLMVAFSEVVYTIWLGDNTLIPFDITVLMAIYTSVVASSTAYSMFLNGIGKLKIQIINTTIISLAYFPMTYLLGLWLGIDGVIISMCILNISGLLLNRIQLYKITTRTAVGLWNM